MFLWPHHKACLVGKTKTRCGFVQLQCLFTKASPGEKESFQQIHLLHYGMSFVPPSVQVWAIRDLFTWTI